MQLAMVACPASLSQKVPDKYCNSNLAELTGA